MVFSMAYGYTYPTPYGYLSLLKINTERSQIKYTFDGVHVKAPAMPMQARL